MFYATYYNSLIGELLLVSTKDSLVGLWIKNQKHYGAHILNEIVYEETEIHKNTKDWLDKYFNGLKPRIEELNLAPIGQEFRQDVWNILIDIPYGKVITYKDITLKIAEKRNQKFNSYRAVGGAVGNNPISIIIPCHRVIGVNNKLTGFAGGLENKIKLLKHEGFDISKLV